THKLCGGASNLDRHVAYESTRHHNVSTCAGDVLGFDVADESGHRASQAPARLPDQLVTLALFLAIAQERDAWLGPAEHLARVNLAHGRELHQVVGLGVDVGADVEEVRKAVLRRHAGAKRGPLDSPDPA